jgi:hypothetical protein
MAFQMLLTGHPGGRGSKCDASAALNSAGGAHSSCGGSHSACFIIVAVMIDAVIDDAP